MILNPLTMVAVFVILLLFCLAIITFFLKRKLNQEIRKLKEDRQEQEKHAAFLDMASEATQTGVWESQPKEGVMFISEQWFRVLGYVQKAEVRPITEHLAYVHPNDRQIVIEFFERYIRGLEKKDFEREIRLRRQDGTYCWVLSKAKAVEWDEEGNPIRIMGLDVNIHSLKKARLDVEKSETKFRIMFEYAPYPVSITSFETGKFLNANKAFFDFHGINRESLTQFSVMDLSTIDDKRHKAILGGVEKDGFLKNQETEIIKKDGTKAHILFSSVLLDIEGEKQILSITLDLTERKKAEKEREKFQERMHHSQKLEAVGILAGGVAHDFNNMLGAIIGYTELTIEQMGPENPHRKNLEEIMRSAHRSAGLVRQLLAFARKQTIEPVVFELNESIEDILKMIRRLIGENIQLSWKPGNGPFMVSMDPSHFDQIIVNLCVNARDAIGDVGRITIETDTFTVAENDLPVQPDMARGEYVRLTISDNGCGMEKDTLVHIFEPFFTTKKIGQGTGMGLATIYGIVKQNNGIITAYSEVKKGTSFTIYLPVHASEAFKEKRLTLEDVSRSKGETVLLIEDDPALLKLNEMMLQRLDYTVFAATTPGEAINIAEDANTEIDMLITDVVMPEMNGKQLADRIKRLRPDIHVLFMSGYTADVIGHQGVLEKGVHFIQKPFSMKKIGGKIREVLD